MEQCLTNKLKKSLKNDGCDITAKQCENNTIHLKGNIELQLIIKVKVKMIDFFLKFMFSEFYGMKAGSRPTFAI